MHHTPTRPLLALTAGCLLTLLPACSITPVYTVRVDNQSSRALQARLERRPTLNEVIEMDGGRVGAGSSRVFGPAKARPFERVYVVIGDRTDLTAFPESIELKRGQWIVTVAASSMTGWGSYQVDIERAKGLNDEDAPDAAGGAGAGAAGARP